MPAWLRRHRARRRPARPRRAPHRRRHPRRRAAPAAAARRAARRPGASRRLPRSPSATARWCARWSATVLRRLGTLRHLLGLLLERGLPADAPRVETALLIGAAQILWLDVPDHAAVDLAVRLVQADRRAARYAGLVNAVLRRVAREGAQRLAGIDAAALDTPDWLMARWMRNYGAETARAIARRQRPRAGARPHREERSPSIGRERSAAACCRPARCALSAHGPVSPLPGYAEGAWWVQDAAAALPARLLGDVARPRVADLCAAPGGKTAQLAAAGARVTAVDRAPARLERLRQNLARLGLAAEIVVADVDAMAGRAVRRRAARCALLVDRHHPPPSRHPLAQARSRHRGARGAAAAAARRARSSWSSRAALLVYCTCSLEPEEGDRQSSRDLLARDPRRAPAADRGRRGRRPRASWLTAGRATCARCPATCPTLIRAWPASTASMPRGCKGFERSLSRGAWPAFACPATSAMVRRARGSRDRLQDGSQRLDVARFGRGTYQTVRVPGARRRFAGSSAASSRIRSCSWPFSFGKADRLVIAPQDLRTADATRASEIYAGRFVFAGKVVICDARSPFEIDPAVRGLGGRRCSASAGCGICAPPNPASPAPMPARWSTNGSRSTARSDPIAWRPDVVARRIISWLSQAPLVLDDSDVRFYRRFLRSLTRQVRHLRHTASDARDGVPRLQAVIALTYAALCMAGQQRAHPRRHQAARRRAASGRSCPTADTSAAIPAR